MNVPRRVSCNVGKLFGSLGSLLEERVSVIFSKPKLVLRLYQHVRDDSKSRVSFLFRSHDASTSQRYEEMEERSKGERKNSGQADRQTLDLVETQKRRDNVR